ncbi:MAG: cadmium-translocating P-type ATPase [Sedimentisphaerales bacterium]|nr:cadmium-translocating P-type ATPase [Sedimentisphaerales bacterium]
MGAHSHHNLLDTEIHDHEHGGTSTQTRTFRVSLSLLGTLLGGTLLINSVITEYLMNRKEQAELMAMAGALLLGAPIIWHAISSLIHGHSHMDELVALAIIAAFATKQYQVAGAVSFFMLLAELIETRTALGARASIESLIRITPTKAHLLAADGSETEIEAHLLEPGQKIRVRPGDNIPADGKVVQGESTVNQATITGESLPVDKSTGDQVFAGTSNLTGSLEVEVVTAGNDTTLGKVQSLIIQAERTRIPIMRIIDRYVKWYTPTILMIAGLLFYFTKHIDIAISALIIACPCAIILATPTAMVAALSCAARLGILIKNVGNLESAGRLNAIIFDKTGTLTTGQMAVTKLTPIEGVDPAEMLILAASTEQFSKHPAARAVIEVAKQARLTLSQPENFEETSGRGVSAYINGQKVAVGRETWLEEQGFDMSPVRGEKMTPPEGLSLLYVARDHRCIGWIGMEDRTREEARNAVKDLSELGMKRLVMVTGDRLAVAKRVAAEMGCSEVKAECLPNEKLNLVHQLQQEGYRVAVVGDGVNDAPALAAGDLGVAMGAAGSDVAINSASIALMNNDLNRLSFLVKLSRTTRNVVWQNLLFGLCFIIFGEVVIAMGLVPPVLAVILHLISSLVIVFNSARLVRMGEELPHHEALVSAGPARETRTEPISGENPQNTNPAHGLT